MCPLHDDLGVLGPCSIVGDVDTKELEALNLLNCSPVDENGGVLCPLFPVIHNHLLCLDHVEGEVVILAPHCQVSDLLPIGSLVNVGMQGEIWFILVLGLSQRCRPSL